MLHGARNLDGHPHGTQGLALITNVFLSAYELQVEVGIPPEAVVLELDASKVPAEVMERAVEMGIFE